MSPALARPKRVPGGGGRAGAEHDGQGAGLGHGKYVCVCVCVHARARVLVRMCVNTPKAAEAEAPQATRRAVRMAVGGSRAVRRPCGPGPGPGAGNRENREFGCGARP